MSLRRRRGHRWKQVVEQMRSRRPWSTTQRRASIWNSGSGRYLDQPRSVPSGERCPTASVAGPAARRGTGPETHRSGTKHVRPDTASIQGYLGRCEGTRTPNWRFYRPESAVPVSPAAACVAAFREDSRLLIGCWPGIVDSGDRPTMFAVIMWTSDTYFYLVGRYAPVRIAAGRVRMAPVGRTETAYGGPGSAVLAADGPTGSRPRGARRPWGTDARLV